MKRLNWKRRKRRKERKQRPKTSTVKAMSSIAAKVKTMIKLTKIWRRRKKKTMKMIGKMRRRRLIADRHRIKELMVSRLDLAFKHKHSLMQMEIKPQL